MRPPHETNKEEPTPLPQLDEVLGKALEQGLDVPLLALRASMESLTSSVSGKSPEGSVLQRALSEVNRIGRNVQDLIEYSVPPAPHPLRCTLDEIASSARQALAPELRERVFQARVSQGRENAEQQAAAEERVVVDGPLVSRCLRRLLENALESSNSDVLLVTRKEREDANFAVVGTGGSFDPSWAEGAFHSSKRRHLGLGLPLVQRDLSLIGGHLDLSFSPRGVTCAQVTVPDGSSQELELAS